MATSIGEKKKRSNKVHTITKCKEKKIMMIKEAATIAFVVLGNDRKNKPRKRNHSERVEKE